MEMNTFTLYDSSTGRVLFSGSASEPAALANPGTAVLVGEQHEDGWIEGGLHYPLPAQPSPHHVFEYTTKQWIDPRTIQELKDAKWSEIKTARNAAEFGTFTWDGSAFDSDAASQSRIQGAAQLATLALMNSQPFSIDWTLADNSVRTLNAQDMIAVGMAMGEHINAQHAKARIKRQAIEAAIAVAEVEAIAW